MNIIVRMDASECGWSSTVNARCSSPVLRVLCCISWISCQGPEGSMANTQQSGGILTLRLFKRERRLEGVCYAIAEPYPPPEERRARRGWAGGVSMFSCVFRPNIWAWSRLSIQKSDWELRAASVIVSSFYFLFDAHQVCLLSSGNRLQECHHINTCGTLFQYLCSALSPRKYIIRHLCDTTFVFYIVYSRYVSFVRHERLNINPYTDGLWGMLPRTLSTLRLYLRFASTLATWSNMLQIVGWRVILWERLQNPAVVHIVLPGTGSFLLGIGIIGWLFLPW